jgi:PTH1 family peptidyl-tRNA hydrolase
MKLIIGLGNPEAKYFKNRHNAGYIFIDEILKNKKPGIVIKKTNVFMNESGSVVKNFVDKYKVSLNDLYIVHDDLDIPLGQFKIQKGVGPKLHYGIASIDDRLRSKDYWRIRVGVDSRDKENRTEGEKYVLEDFSSDEEKILLETISKAIKKFFFLVNNG